MENKELQFLQLPVAELKPYEKNAKIHTAAQIRAVADSIREFGFLNPVLVNANHEIIAGHCRVLAAKEIGLDTVPCLLEEHLTETQRRAYILADNKLAESEWNMELVNAELDSLNLAGFDVKLTGFEPAPLPEPGTASGSGDPDDAPLPPEEPTAKRGNIWQLGRHRLMCGDSTDAAAVQALFDGASPALILTDPPYCSGGWQEAGKSAGSKGGTANRDIANDKLSTRGFQSLLRHVLDLAPDAGFAYIFADWRMWIALYDVAEASGFGVRSMIVWDKATAGMGIGWRCQHELCLFGVRGTPQFDNHKAVGNVIQCKRTGNKLHATEKPVELIEVILGVTDWLDTVYDPFSGSGTTLVACERQGRSCYAMELEPRYCDVIVKRWEDMTGQKAVLLNG